ncbi:hypothetical protein DFS33DRAFT_1274635 [Desarmillaria ectypa]|nr:hypothetical protein DFS33DRAFT_1274635 [Desarmillaria ectypa]
MSIFGCRNFSSSFLVGFRRSLHKGNRRAESEKDNVRESLPYQRFPHPPHSPPNSGRKRVYIPSAFEAASEENITLGNSHQTGCKRSQSIFNLAKRPGERGKTERPASLRCALTVSPDHVPYRTLCHVAISFVFPPSDSYTTQSTWVPLTAVNTKHTIHPVAQQSGTNRVLRPAVAFPPPSAQINWAKYFLPMYRSIRLQDAACLNVFPYGLFAAYTDRFQSMPYAKLGTPTTDLRDLVSLRRWRRGALQMLSDLLRLHLTESLDLPALATKASLAIPLSSNLPDDTTVGGAKTSLPASPTPRLICEGPASYCQTRRCVQPVGELSDPRCLNVFPQDVPVASEERVLHSLSIFQNQRRQAAIDAYEYC